MSSRAPSSYFDTFYPLFTPDNSASIFSNFKRLAKLKGWQPESKRFRKEYQECLNSEYQGFVSGVFRKGKPEGWRDLCEEVGIRNPPESIKGCKKALQTVNVNLIDLIESRRQGKAVRLFPDRQALREYTIKHNKVFPKDRAKADELLKIFLREIF